MSEEQINDLLSKVGATNRSGKYLDRLTPGSREVLDLFQVWLVAEDNKSETTARAYKGYVAQALCHIEDGGDVQELSTDVRSGINALRRFQESGAAETLANATVEDDWDVSDVPASGDTE